nr:IucA/IucC family protein [Pararobbsia alpina]
MLAQDLLDALWLEDLHGFRGRSQLSRGPGDQAVLAVSLADDATLRWLGSHIQGPRVLRLRAAAPVVLQRSASSASLSVAQTLEALRRAPWWPEPSDRLTQLLTLAQRQMARTFLAQGALLARVAARPRSLAAWEAVCCLRDRPFHPLARAKLWPDFSGDDFDVESGRTVELHWVAATRDALASGTTQEREAQPVATALLDEVEFAALAQRARERGAAASALWLAVHPWQWLHLQRRAPELLMRCVDLGGGLGAALPTASLRTLSITAAERPANDIHLKLSLSVQALGASRVMPPRYLHNGVLAQACLEELRRRDAWLGAHLELCDETQWWALRAGDDRTSLIHESGELACMLRRYPETDGWLLPMAACAAITSDTRLPALDALCADPALRVLAGPPSDAPVERVWRVFGEMARLLIETGLRCFAHGVLPELHGQNVMLRIGIVGMQALVLRDHDTLRVCPAAMGEHGIDPPAYLVDRSTPNTLILDRAETLLAYFQTLAVEVNLYAIIAAIAECYDTDEATGWNIVARTLHETVDTALQGFPHAQRCARQQLFDAPQWPFKQLLAPLAARTSVGTGMPSGLGTIANPLWTAAGVSGASGVSGVSGASSASSASGASAASGTQSR